MRYPVFQFSCAVLLVLFTASAGLADEIKLTNGEVLRGKVTDAAGGSLQITSDGVGSVSAPFDKIISFYTEEPVALHFKDGTVLNKKIEAGADGKIRVATGPDNTILDFQIADIQSINPPPSVWTGSLSAGGRITRGNSHTQSTYASMEAVKRSDNDRISFDGGYSSGRQKDPTTKVVTTTERQSYAGMQYDYFFSKKLYGYANARGEKDAIADLDLRFITGAGAGYQFYEEPDFNLNGEAGLTWISENNKRPSPDEDYWAARVAYGLSGAFNDANSYFHNAVWYPAFEHEGGHRVNADAGIRSTLTGSLFAEVKAIWDWDSTPAISKERVDVTYLFSLGWSF